MPAFSIATVIGWARSARTFRLFTVPAASFRAQTSPVDGAPLVLATAPTLAALTAAIGAGAGFGIGADGRPIGGSSLERWSVGIVITDAGTWSAVLGDIAPGISRDILGELATFPAVLAAAIATAKALLAETDAALLGEDGSSIQSEQNP
jgi:hypothetical protein